MNAKEAMAQRDKETARSRLNRLRAALAWTPFSEFPPPHRRLLVTNNLEARDAFGEMSHVWLVLMVHVQTDGEITGFAEGVRLRGLTHWRLAIPEGGSDA